MTLSLMMVMTLILKITLRMTMKIPPMKRMPHAGWLSSLTVGQLPVNRLFTVDAGQPTPDLKCIVGFHSIEAEVWEERG